MKLIHTADWHLGRMLYGRSLLEDQAYFLREILKPALAEEKPDLLVIAGDVYDRQIASVEAIRLFDSFLSETAELGIPTAVIAGNHDGAERMALAKNLLRKSGVYMAAGLDDARVPMLLENGGERTQVFLLPFLDPAVVRDYFHDDTLRGEAACMARCLDMLREYFEAGTQKILISHCFAAGAEVSDSESGIWAGGSSAVPASLWQDFDYVALGHLHRAQKAGENGRYAGSPLKYSVDEQQHKKSFTVVKLHDGKAEIHLTPVQALRDVRRISGNFLQLLAAGQENPCEDYVELELTDKNPVLMAAERLREYYPNLLAVTNQWVAQAAVGGFSENRKKQDDLTIFQAFLSEICGMQAGEAEIQWFLTAQKEMGEEAK